MNKLSETEKDILCANHDWQNCRLSNDGLDIEAIQNNPSNPENIGEWINMGQLVDYDDELDELSQDEPEDTDQIEKQILDEINQQEGRNYQSVTFLSPDDYDKKYEYWGHPKQYSIDGDAFEIGQYCEIGEDEDTAELIACIFENEPEPETVDLSEILENIKSGKYTEHEMTELPVAGDPPKGNHLGVWSWNGKQAIVGYSIDDFEIVDYGYFDDGPEPETVDLNEIYYLIDDEQYGDAAVMTKVELEEFASFCREQNPEWDDPTTVATNGRKVLDLYRFDIPMLMGNGEHVNIPYYYRRNGEYVGRVEK